LILSYSAGNILVISIDQSKKALNAFEQDSTLVVIVELSQKSWLVAGGVPGVDRHPLKKFDADENRLFALIDRWKQEAIEAERSRAEAPSSVVLLGFGCT
jgi:hypothetical protein